MTAPYGALQRQMWYRVGPRPTQRQRRRFGRCGWSGSVATHTMAVRRPRVSRQMRRNLEGWLFASPWIVGFVLFTVGPMLASAVMAFMKWDLLSPPSFTGLDNFKQALWGDPLVWVSLRVTTVYAIVSVPLNLVLGLTLALLLN